MEKNTIQEIQNSIQENLGETGTATLTTIKKVGGEMEGIRITFTGDNTKAMVIYPQNLERMLDSGTSMQDIGRYIANDAKSKRNEMQKLSFPNKEDFRKNLFVQVINKDVNKDLLKTAVHDSMDDMAAIVRCKVSESAEGVSSFIVTRDNMQAFQMTKGEILSAAYKNTADQEFKLQTMNEIMADTMREAGMTEGQINLMLPDDNMQMYVLTNSEKVNGANAIVCPEVLSDAYDRIGEPYYILPSSTHEVILVPESAGVQVDDLRQMVREVNTAEVQPQDLLSFNVFKFDGRKLSTARDEKETLTEAKEKIKTAVMH